MDYETLLVPDQSHQYPDPYRRRVFKLERNFSNSTCYFFKQNKIFIMLKVRKKKEYIMKFLKNLKFSCFFLLFPFLTYLSARSSIKLVVVCFQQKHHLLPVIGQNHPQTFVFQTKGKRLILGKARVSLVGPLPAFSLFPVKKR